MDKQIETLLEEALVAKYTSIGRIIDAGTILHELGHLVTHYNGDMDAVVAFLTANTVDGFNNALDMLLVGDRDGDIVINPTEAQDDNEFDTAAIDSHFVGEINVLEVQRIYRELSCPEYTTKVAVKNEITKRAKSARIKKYVSQIKKFLNELV